MLINPERMEYFSIKLPIITVTSVLSLHLYPNLYPLWRPRWHLLQCPQDELVVLAHQTTQTPWNHNPSMIGVKRNVVHGDLPVLLLGYPAFDWLTILTSERLQGGSLAKSITFDRGFRNWWGKRLLRPSSQIKATDHGKGMLNSETNFDLRPDDQVSRGGWCSISDSC